MKGQRIDWTQAQLTFIKRRRNLPRRDLHAEFERRFGAGVSLGALTSLCKRTGWLTGPRLGRFKGRLRSYSDAEVAFIRRRRKRPRRELHREFVERFGRPDLSFPNFMNLCKRIGAFTGRTGRFEKGIVPANKGQKMPFNPNRARTQFKKGQRPHNTKHAGHERVDKEGYVWISIDQPNPHTGFERRYVMKHRWLWENMHGPVPPEMVLKCKGEKSNPDPSNWELIPRSMLPRLNNRWGRAYDEAPAELKPTIMAVAKLEHALHERSRG